jgi:cysteine desulfurase
MRQLYFDYNATTPVAPSVREALTPFLGEHFGHPASSHSLGLAAHEALEDARGHLANFLGCDPDEIVFTSGGTESNNLALVGLALASGLAAGGHLVISAVEHASVREPARFLERLGFDLTIVPVTSRGVVQASAVRKALRDDTRLVSIMHANHEVGAVQPIREIALACRERNIPLHTDASQTAGKLRVQVDELEVDLLTLAGHKMYAPKGIGALFVRQGTVVEPLLRGAGQEAGLRSGVENVAGIVALGAAARLAAKHLEESLDPIERLRDQLQTELEAGVGDGLVVHARHAPRLPNTLAVSFPGVLGHELLQRMPELCAATGSANHSETEAISSTLAAMHVPTPVARGTIRLSLGAFTTEDEVHRAAALLLGAWEALRDG